MEAPQLSEDFEPTPQPDKLEVRVEEEDDIPFRHLGQKVLEPHLWRNNQDVGLIDVWVIGGQAAIIDGMYPTDGSEVILTPNEWRVVADSMHGQEAYKYLRRIDFPGGKERYFETI